ncbi:hypothetical protein Q1695_011131 [Nippostrongylus brasiliensis]|nr:hypothetical protein Q1695_011131 [Nippostrongylus brasiliensis]
MGIAVKQNHGKQAVKKLKKKEVSNSELSQKTKKKKSKQKGDRQKEEVVEKVNIEQHESDEEMESNEEIDSDDDNVEKAAGSKKAGSKHLQDLEKLKQSDPEFYKFLQEQDADLLQFHASDEEDDEDEDEEEEIDDEMEGEEGDQEGKKVAVESESRMPKAKKDASGRLIIDGRMLTHLQAALDPEDPKQHVAMEDIRFAVEAFNACVSRVGAEVEVPKYIINEQKVFYEVVRLCFEKLGDAFMTLVTGPVKSEPGVAEESRHIKVKHLKTYQSQIKQYLSSVLKFANEVQTPDVIISTLKAIRRMTDLYAHFKKIAKSLFKVLVRIWSRKTLDCRVGAYVCMMQLVKSHPEHFVSLYKSCYLGFVANSRDVSAESWPLLHFMHRTFAELTVLHPNLAYQYAFVYIRQIAIHLRNAVISKKRKDMVQTVYNWQMMQCLYLWTRVVSKAHSVHDCEAICELTYPLTQLIHGVLKLFHSLRYIPLRLHCISLLIQLQANCGIFIPTLTLSTELLEDVQCILAKKPKTVKNAKAVDMESSLKVGATVLEEISFRAALCDHLFRITLQSAHLICAQASFPDVIVPIVFRIRTFLQKTRSVEFARCFRSLMEKLEEHSKFVVQALLVKEFDIRDDLQVMSLKLALNNPDSPLRVFYRQWEKAWRLKQQLLLKSTTKQPKKENAAQKKTPKNTPATTPKDTTDAEMPKKKKRKSAPPAADKADDTIADHLEDLGNWSDSN